MNSLEAAKNVIQSSIDLQTQSLSRADYQEFLLWLESEAECRIMAFDDENCGDGG